MISLNTRLISRPNNQILNDFTTTCRMITVVPLDRFRIVHNFYANMYFEHLEHYKEECEIQLDQEQPLSNNILEWLGGRSLDYEIANRKTLKISDKLEFELFYVFEKGVYCKAIITGMSFGCIEYTGIGPKSHKDELRLKLISLYRKKDKEDNRASLGEEIEKKVVDWLDSIWFREYKV